MRPALAPPCQLLWPRGEGRQQQRDDRVAAVPAIAVQWRPSPSPPSPMPPLPPQPPLLPLPSPQPPDDTAATVRSLWRASLSLRVPYVERASADTQGTTGRRGKAVFKKTSAPNQVTPIPSTPPPAYLKSPTEGTKPRPAVRKRAANPQTRSAAKKSWGRGGRIKHRPPACAAATGRFCPQRKTQNCSDHSSTPYAPAARARTHHQ